jgi:hypothetical protein
MQSQQSLIPTSHLKALEKTGMHGQYVQVALTKKQQKSQLVHNYIKYLEEFYEDFEVQPNLFQSFFPKQIQK